MDWWTSTTRRVICHSLHCSSFCAEPKTIIRFMTSYQLVALLEGFIVCHAFWFLELCPELMSSKLLQSYILVITFPELKACLSKIYQKFLWRRKQYVFLAGIRLLLCIGDCLASFASPPQMSRAMRWNSSEKNRYTIEEKKTWKEFFPLVLHQQDWICCKMSEETKET